MIGQEPLVSIGLPTFNRSSLLSKAIESVLAQTYTNIELVVSDNASDDATQSICEEYAKKDSRIKYTRQHINTGPACNFAYVLQHSVGEYFMWLGDDDWIDDNYLEYCVSELIRNPDYSLVGGQALSYTDNKLIVVNKPTNLLQNSGLVRILSYYAQVGDNGIFYGVMRRRQALINPVRTTIGGDWLQVAGLAFVGKVKTINDVYVHRNRDDSMSAGLIKMSRTIGVPITQAVFRYLHIAWIASKDVLYANPVYLHRSLAFRLSSSAIVFATIFLHKSVKQNMKNLISTILRKLLGLARYTLLRGALRKIGI